MAVLFTADLHLLHRGILDLCSSTRPFSSIDDQTDHAVEAWKKAVRRDDTVVVGGDFAHRAGDGKKLRRIFDALPGKKVLLKGNHDGDATLSLPWDAVHDVMHASFDNTRVTLCHYPWLSWPAIRKGALMLYGHHHGRLPGNSQSMDIGVDVMGFAPVRLHDIKARLALLPTMQDPEGDLNNDNGGLTL